MNTRWTETHTLGEATRQVVVHSKDCVALAKRAIAHAGVGDAAVPYRIVRTNLSGAYLHGCLGGEGRMLLDGRWRVQRAGMVSMAPAHVLHAFHAVPDCRWQYCWVRYMPESPRSSDGHIAPVMAEFDAEPLSQAILGLHREMATAEDPSSTTLWAELIEHYVARFTEPLRRDSRLGEVWRTVQADLARPWTLAELAAHANVSPEHLRRLCQRSLGRSPMQQLAYLRMQHAAHLLAAGPDTVERVALAVGYQNPFAFSNTFKRMTGFRPSGFQRHKRMHQSDEP